MYMRALQSFYEAGAMQNITTMYQPPTLKDAGAVRNITATYQPPMMKRLREVKVSVCTKHLHLLSGSYSD